MSREFYLFCLGLTIGLIVSGIFDAIIYFIPKLSKKYWHSHPKFFGYHLHHSLFGLVFIIVGLFTTIFFIGIGIGIIVIHTVTDKHGFVFIEKN